MYASGLRHLGSVFSTTSEAHWYLFVQPRIVLQNTCSLIQELAGDNIIGGIDLSNVLLCQQALMEMREPGLFFVPPQMRPEVHAVYVAEIRVQVYKKVG